MKWTANEVRKTFLEYFKEKGHTIVPSSPLLPKGQEGHILSEVYESRR